MECVHMLPTILLTEDSLLDKTNSKDNAEHASLMASHEEDSFPNNIYQFLPDYNNNTQS